MKNPTCSPVPIRPTLQSSTSCLTPHASRKCGKWRMRMFGHPTHWGTDQVRCSRKLFLSKDSTIYDNIVNSNVKNVLFNFGLNFLWFISIKTHSIWKIIYQKKCPTELIFQTCKPCVFRLKNALWISYDYDDGLFTC